MKQGPAPGARAGAKPGAAGAAAAQQRGGAGGEPSRREPAAQQQPAAGPRAWIAQAKQQQQLQRPASPHVEIMLPGRIPASAHGAQHGGGGGDGEQCDSPTARSPARRISNRVGDWAHGGVRSSQSSRSELMHVLGQMEQILDKNDEPADPDDVSAAPPGPPPAASSGRGLMMQQPAAAAAAVAAAAGRRPAGVIVEDESEGVLRSPDGPLSGADSALGSPSSYDASGHNIEALRQLCERELGFDKFVAAYQCVPFPLDPHGLIRRSIRRPAAAVK